MPLFWRTATQDEMLREFMVSLRGKIPNYGWFKITMKNLGWSHQRGMFSDARHKERVQTVLEVLEEFDSGRAVNLEVTIEHILPDAEGAEHAQIDNLLLLEENLNRQCADRPLEEKRPIYAQSAIWSTRGFAMRYKEQHFEPQRRTRFMAKVLYNNILRLPEAGEQ